MSEIKTKFDIGDVVFHADTVTEAKKHPCPDCLGSGKWEAVSPAGERYDFGCPRCGSGYKSDQSLDLSYTVHAPRVQRLTIGSVRVDTHNRDKPVTYMCQETGVGSGRVYDENELYATEEEAQREAAFRASQSNENTDWITKKYDRTLELSDYQLGNAALKSARDMNNYIRGKLTWLFQDLRDCETVEAVHETLDDFNLRSEHDR